MDMLFGTKNGGDFLKLIDNLWPHLKDLYQPRFAVTTMGATFSGELFERTPELLVLRSPLERKVMEGPNQGKEVFQYHYINLRAIVSLTLEMAEQPEEKR